MRRKLEQVFFEFHHPLFQTLEQRDGANGPQIGPSGMVCPPHFPVLKRKERALPAKDFAKNQEQTTKYILQ